MNRSTLSLGGAVVALAVLTGAASLSGGSESAATPKGAVTTLPVQRSTVVCPAPSPSEFAETVYTSFTPATTSNGTGGTGGAQLVPALDKAKPLAPLKQTGKGVTVTTDKPGAPALIGTADGPLAPGWTVQQNTVVDAGPGRGLLGTSCITPDSEFWFPGASTATGRQDYLHLVDPDDAPAVVDVELYGKDGLLKASTGDGITVPGKSAKPVLLSTLVADKVADLTVHVVVRSGRVGAAVQAADSKVGTDWLPPAADPATSLVMPGIPADATSVHLVAYATGTDDADLTLKLATSTGLIAPAGHETLHVKAGMTATADLGNVTRGDPGSLVIGSSTVHSAVPVVAGLRITRGKGDKQEMAFLPATPAISTRATVADNRDKGSTLGLTALGKDANVKITSAPGPSGGTTVTKTVVIKAGTTVSLQPQPPSQSKGGYAVTVERLSGGPVYASRMLALPLGGVPMFTIQPLPDDRGMVQVPQAASDLAILDK
ncbi:DUF5719 family protein [Actinacidiphila paucisporea]|uniref:Secreted protein n=1 Tax=Actinacidiphila paucisporea TaxID=310782 RepID=A0A1M7FB45_9ACTN|nr:DUF5719 family protein [Actinacidiphila paucisporea]SHM01175.1 hypothetical protein SAMN05216499_107256 [Actinacidiphila paucisporea]